MKELITSSGTVIFVDDEDYDYFNQWKWYQGRDGLVYRNAGSFGHLALHIEIMKRAGRHEEGKEVDHKDRNKLNSQKYNLRMATHSQNGMNKIGKGSSFTDYKGIYFNTKRRLWVAQIKKNKYVRYLGSFNTEIEAARAYNEAAKEVFGEFAVLNEGI